MGQVLAGRSVYLPVDWYFDRCCFLTNCGKCLHCGDPTNVLIPLISVFHIYKLIKTIHQSDNTSIKAHDKWCVYVQRRSFFIDWKLSLMEQNDRGELIKWLCASCLTTLNNSCLFDYCMWRIYQEVVLQRRGDICLGGCSSNCQGEALFM